MADARPFARVRIPPHVENRRTASPPSRIVATLLGHRSLNMMRCYAHVAPELVVNAAKRAQQIGTDWRHATQGSAESPPDSSAGAWVSTKGC